MSEHVKKYAEMISNLNPAIYGQRNMMFALHNNMSVSEAEKIEVEYKQKRIR